MEQTNHKANTKEQPKSELKVGYSFQKGERPWSEAVMQRVRRSIVDDAPSLSSLSSIGQMKRRRE